MSLWRVVINVADILRDLLRRSGLRQRPIRFERYPPEDR
jgi:hypothetical protein